MLVICAKKSVCLGGPLIAGGPMPWNNWNYG